MIFFKCRLASFIKACTCRSSGQSDAPDVGFSQGIERFHSTLKPWQIHVRPLNNHWFFFSFVRFKFKCRTIITQIQYIDGIDCAISCTRPDEWNSDKIRVIRQKKWIEKSNYWVAGFMETPLGWVRLRAARAKDLWIKRTKGGGEHVPHAWHNGGARWVKRGRQAADVSRSGWWMVGPGSTNSGLLFVALWFI